MQTRLPDMSHGPDFGVVTAGATRKKSLMPFFCDGSITFPFPVFVDALVFVLGLFSSIPMASNSFSNSSCNRTLSKL